MLTALQQEQRLHGLGASEIAAALGLDPYRTPFDVWAEKVGLVKPFAGNEYTRWGNRLEPVMIAAYAELEGVEVRPNQATVQHVENEWMFCTPDALVMDGPQIIRGLETKNRNIRMIKDWGEPGTDQVPEAVALQVHWSMAVTATREWDVAVLLGGYDFRRYRIFADPSIQDSIIELGRAFWFDHVKKGVAPDPIYRDNETIGRILRQTSEQLKPADQAVNDALTSLLEVRAQLEQLEQVKDGLEATLKGFIGDAAGILSPVVWKCTWKQARPSLKTDWEALATQLLPADSAEARKLIEAHTREVPGSRRFLITASREA